MKKVTVVIEAGQALTGLDTKNNFVYTFVEESIFEITASSKNDAVMQAIKQVKPQGRTVRVFEGKREIFTNSDF